MCRLAQCWLVSNLADQTHLWVFGGKNQKGMQRQMNNSYCRIKRCIRGDNCYIMIHIRRQRDEDIVTLQKVTNLQLMSLPFS
jgi:hypothetical protein